MRLSKELRQKITAFLNTKMDFLDAIEAGDFELAEVIAHRLLAAAH